MNYPKKDRQQANVLIKDVRSEPYTTKAGKQTTKEEVRFSYEGDEANIHIATSYGGSFKTSEWGKVLQVDIENSGNFLTIWKPKAGGQKTYPNQYQRPATQNSANKAQQEINKQRMWSAVAAVEVLQKNHPEFFVDKSIPSAPEQSDGLEDINVDNIEF